MTLYNNYYIENALFGESTGLANSTQPYKYTGKELDRMHGLDLHDHGARWSDTNLGRWWKVDSKAEYFYDTSPYVLCADNPWNTIDTDGNKIVFINGKIGFNSPPSGAPYWGGIKSPFVRGAEHFFRDNHIYFANIDYSFLSSANSRMRQGYNWAQDNYNELIANMDGNESFHLISHSMGGAFSKGVENYLKEKGYKVDMSIMINTYQVDKIYNEKNSETIYVDYQNTNDPVLFWFDLNLGLGQLQNSDIKIREKSEEGFFERHSSPIANSDDFWRIIRAKIQEYLQKE